MSLQNFAYTDAGMSLLLAAATGSRLTITKAVSGTGLVDPEAMAYQTDVSGEKHTCELLSITAVGEGDTAARKVSVRITGAEAAYELHQIGLYGRPDNSAQDTLLMLAQDERGVEVPAAAQDAEFEIIFNVLIAISRDAKITLSLDADMRGLKQFIRQEIHDKSAHALIADLTIPADAWTLEDTEAEYGCTARVEITGCTEEHSPQVTVCKESILIAQRARLCPVAQTIDEHLVLWAKKPPTAAIHVVAQLLAPRSQEPLDEWEDDSTASETSLLGDAVLGDAIVGM